MDFYDSFSDNDNYSPDSDRFDYEEAGEYDDEIYSDNDLVGLTFKGEINGVYISKVIRKDRNGSFVMTATEKHYLTVKDVRDFKRRMSEYEEEENDY